MSTILPSTSNVQDIESADAEYLIFYSSIDPSSGVMWCPDCRAVKDLVDNVFGEQGAPSALVVFVGQRTEWKDSSNIFRAEPWNVSSIPTIARKADMSTRLVESDINEEDLKQFISAARGAALATVTEEQAF